MISAAAPPGVVIGLGSGAAVLCLLGAGLLVSAARHAGPRHPSAPGQPSSPGPPAGWSPFADDDLPDFAAFPPGSAQPAPSAPGPAADPPGRRAPEPPARTPAPSGDRPRRGRVTGAVLAALGVALGLVAALLATPLATGKTDHRRAPADRPAAGSTAVSSPAPVPASPFPGRPGAGALADASLPPDRGGLTATLSFGGVVLEPRAVGATVTYPQVSVAVSDDGTTALAHVRLPTFNCLAPDPPPDPLAAGCVRSLEEFADLAAPALAVTRSAEGGVHLSGRFPTYLRPNGSPPAYTGRVYELSVSATPTGPRSGSTASADGELFLAGGRTTTVPTAGSATGVNVLRYAD